MPAKLEVAFFQVGRLHCCCCCVNQVVVMLVGIYHDLVGIYHDEKIREVCIKVRLPPALLAVVGQVTKHTSVKWRIGRALYRHRRGHGSESRKESRRMTRSVDTFKKLLKTYTFSIVFYLRYVCITNLLSNSRPRRWAYCYAIRLLRQFAVELK